MLRVANPFQPQSVDFAASVLQGGSSLWAMLMGSRMLTVAAMLAFRAVADRLNAGDALGAQKRLGKRLDRLTDQCVACELQKHALRVLF